MNKKSMEKQHKNYLQKIIIKTINWTSQDDGTKTGKITELNTFIKDKRNCKDIEQSIRIKGIEKFKVTTFVKIKVYGKLLDF